LYNYQSALCMPEFRSKKECEEYAAHNKLAFFQKDINQNFAKIYVAESYESIYAKIRSGDNNYYESWGSSQLLKLYFDYDRKVAPEINEANDLNVNHKAEILNIVNKVKKCIPNITNVYILKSIPDDKKKSYHVIFEGVHFPNYRVIKTFIEENVKPEFKDMFASKIIDTSVYSPICFRSVLCTKFNQNRPLYLLDTQAFLENLEEVIIEDVTYDLFRKTCITLIEGNSTLYNYKSIEKKKESASKKTHLMSGEDIYTDKDVIKKYLDILDASRYTDRNKWLNIGYILYSIDKDYIDLWRYFSSKWSNYDEGDTDIAWGSFINGEYIHTIHNLIHLANIDNPSDCQEINKEIPDHDIKFLKPFDNIISKLIYRLYGEKFVCSNPEKNEWYYFNGIRWVKENKSYTLRKLTINEVYSKVEAYRLQLLKTGVDEEVVKNYHRILQILGSGNKMNCLELEFYNSNFHKILDQKKHLLGFDNGVYDLEMMEFREGFSSDYISMTTGYPYIPYPQESVEYQELFQLICQILPDEQCRNFTLKSLATCLDGYTNEENFYIYSGKNSTGGNGKSTITDLALKALGEYSYVAPISLITNKRESSNNANSALAGIRNKRIVIMQEPEVNEVIQAGIMKALSGGDKISTRELHSTQMEFKPHCKFFVCCNKIPSISDIDGGVIRRLKITEFTSRFVEKPNDETINGIHEYKIDKSIKNKLDNYAPVFMCILLDYYKMYRAEGLIPPEKVILVTKKYENDNNVIKQFIDENVIIDKNGEITREELKEYYDNRTYDLRTHFKNFKTFISYIENGLCIEFKLDRRRSIYKLQGARMKQDFDNSDDED
jgi:P4 family phage/plasmid primase-like protien